MTKYSIKWVKNIRIYRRKLEQLKSLPRLLARLHPNSPKYKEIEDKLYRVQAGYAGEVKVDKYLESTIFPQKVIVLTDVQLPVAENFLIQIDTLILSRSSIILLEIKNIAGTLTYIPNPPISNEPMKGVVRLLSIVPLCN